MNMPLISLTGWWCNNHLEKYEFVNGKDDISYMKWKIRHVWSHQPDEDHMKTWEFHGDITIEYDRLCKLVWDSFF
jgi:hypothetical protein